MSFTGWAVAIGFSIADQLGANNITEEITLDVAIWAFGTNVATAKARAGPLVGVTFTRGDALWFVIGQKPALVARLISATLCR
jgi:hypothetical protein